MKQNRILRRGRRADNSLLPALAVISFASCTATPPESRTVEIDPSAITVFEEGEALWGVRDIIQSGEAIWVLTEAEPFLRAYSPSGRVLAEFGRMGEGPGELRNPWAVSTPTPAGDVTVWDLASRSRLTFTTTGALVSSAPAPNLPEGRSRRYRERHLRKPVSTRRGGR